MSNPGASNIARATKCWGRAVPDWVAILARACDAASQRQTAESVGYSAAVINQVLGNSYKGDLAKVERAVRRELMPQTVRCPVLGSITDKTCFIHHTRPSRANHMAVRLARACPKCPNRKDKA